ncbi:pimeloyl-ACP methyl ester carboxylesterase [Ralstonia sp. GP73]|jgi:pimeloyl-ACP methyl ester carboxylesterase|uniref:AB hydrolase superfamily protein YdjP n=3 Tax=Ralstonia TaxID=48736 RepID=A0AAD2BKB2_9RALS|nr:MULTISPECIES: alpha/beta hydrolase [Ralstonia]MBT2176243.1 alpha/beta hydrolase [Ralstonia pickettii]MDH6640609.1 pimeloyl-ACP methyl ester carboxylesterase [Ralstonia sp. GP73]OCS44030.1 alpha/beta hydrolase [Ralstonia pickettii]CAJ0708285.1 AB hydrolase superfamily protein YdjP [Ralstonia sp. LMG 18095]CAJ0779281.1 AB hydrolase superfamily protein YdjP [Ralstonia sp. LMG 18095]
MDTFDDDLTRFAAHGAEPLPPAVEQGHVEHDGARIWYATFGAGTPVILLHGGLGHGGNWGYQVPALMTAGYRPIVIDSRGHGRSTRDAQPYAYTRMASDVRAVMDALRIDRAAFIGWSDGACVALTLAMQTPERAIGVFFFGCNMDPSGAKPFAPTPVIDRCFGRHLKDYTALSSTPDDFDAFVEAVTEMMQTQPNATAEELAATRVPVTIAQSEHDEFIWPEHAHYLARTLPEAQFVLLPGVSHFAPLQRPAVFNDAVRAFLHGICQT